MRSARFGQGLKRGLSHLEPARAGRYGVEQAARLGPQRQRQQPVGQGVGPDRGHLLIVHHPDATYFNVGTSRVEQLMNA